MASHDKMFYGKPQGEGLDSFTGIPFFIYRTDTYSYTYTIVFYAFKYTGYILILRRKNG